VPCIVTGVLLMDQRFWGMRTHALGVGPPPVHIQDLTSGKVSVAGLLREALFVEGDSGGITQWQKCAQKLARELEAASETDDGVWQNVQAVVEMANSPHCQPPCTRRC
jgi:hypothetical protein